MYKCTVLTTFQPKKVYLGLAEGEFKKQRYYTTANYFKTRPIRTAQFSPVISVVFGK